MDSRVAYTDEIDDLNEAVQEIFSQMADLELKANSLAIVLHLSVFINHASLFTNSDKSGGFIK